VTCRGSRALSLVAALCVAAAIPPPASADRDRAAITGDRPSECQARRRRRRRAAPRLTAEQRAQIERRHREAGAGVVRRWERQEPPPLVLLPLQGAARVTIVPSTGEGGFEADDLVLASQALASRDGGLHEIHPRLLELLYRTVRHFRSPYVHVVSGYRNGRATSRHTQGRAIDFVLPGIPDRRLASYVRSFGYVGVGIYPTSGFVHLDVRARSHFWSDSSAPDQPNRERPMLEPLTHRYDAAARRRGELPVADVESAEVAEAGSEEATAAAEATAVAEGG
jgi:hypothetical protein